MQGHGLRCDVHEPHSSFRETRPPPVKCLSCKVLHKTVNRTWAGAGESQIAETHVRHLEANQFCGGGRRDQLVVNLAVGLEWKLFLSSDEGTKSQELQSVTIKGLA